VTATELKNNFQHFQIQQTSPHATDLWLLSRGWTVNFANITLTCHVMSRKQKNENSRTSRHARGGKFCTCRV